MQGLHKLGLLERFSVTILSLPLHLTWRLGAADSLYDTALTLTTKYMP